MLLFVSMASAAGTAVGAATVVKAVLEVAKGGVEDVAGIVENGDKVVKAVEGFSSSQSCQSEEYKGRHDLSYTSN